MSEKDTILRFSIIKPTKFIEALYPAKKKVSIQNAIWFCNKSANQDNFFDKEIDERVYSYNEKTFVKTAEGIQKSIKNKKLTLKGLISCLHYLLNANTLIEPYHQSLTTENLDGFLDSIKLTNTGGSNFPEKMTFLEYFLNRVEKSKEMENIDVVSIIQRLQPNVPDTPYANPRLKGIHKHFQKIKRRLFGRTRYSLGFLSLFSLTFFFLIVGEILAPYVRNWWFQERQYDLAPYKVVILPFDQKCGFQNSYKDVGSVIQDNLLRISKHDSLNLIIDFLDGFTITKSSKNDPDNYYKEILDKYDAQYLIYGSYYDRCEGQDSAQYCVNYISSNAQVPQGIKAQNTSTKNYHFATMDDINHGFLQDEIEALIYYNAMMIAWLNFNNLKSLKYANKLIDSFNIKSSEVFYSKAKCLHELNKPNEALSAINQAIQLNPTAEMYDTRSYINLGAQKFEEAKKDAITAMKLDRRYIATYAKFIAGSEFDKALELLDSVISMDIDRKYILEAHLQRGRLFSVKGFHEEAVEDFIVVSEGLPMYFSLHSRVVIEYLLLHNAQKAIQWCNRALFTDDLSPSFFILRSESYRKHGNKSKAVKDFENAIDLGLPRYEAHQIRASLREMLKEDQLANEDRNKAIEIALNEGMNVSWSKEGLFIYK